MSNPKHNQLLLFLETSGALNSGDADRIRLAKREYRRQYQRDYKRLYRAKHAETRVILGKEERNIIDRSAREHRMERTSFLKHATLAYIKRTFIVPNQGLLASMEQ